MEGLIQKSGYIRPGNGGGHYAEYIATRDGVEELKPGGYLSTWRSAPGPTDCSPPTAPADLEQTMGGDQHTRRSGMDLHLLAEAGGRRPAGV